MLLVSLLNQNHFQVLLDSFGLPIKVLSTEGNLVNSPKLFYDGDHLGEVLSKMQNSQVPAPGTVVTLI